MQNYVQLGFKILSEGNQRGDRTGTGTLSLFGPQLEFDLRKGFPLVTTKKTHIKGIIAELLWFLEGSTNNERLHELGATIWDEWAISETDIEVRPKTHPELCSELAAHRGLSTVKAVHLLSHADRLEGIDRNDDPYNPGGGMVLISSANISLTTEVVSKVKNGDLGPIYGKQWTNWATKKDEPGINQIDELINGLLTRPFSRRHVVSAWNVSDLPDESHSPQQNVINGRMALAPCHCLFQFYVESIPLAERLTIARAKGILGIPDPTELNDEEMHVWLDTGKVDSQYLSCKLYQR